MAYLSLAATIVDRLYRWLDENPGWIGVLWSALKSFSAHQGSSVAAAFAYYTLFSLFPLILFAIALSSFFVESARAQALILSAVTSYLPAAGELVQDNVHAVLRARGPVGLVATISFLWSASGVFGTIIVAVDQAWGISIPRPFWQSRLLLLTVTAVSGFVLALSLFSPLILGLLQALNGSLGFTYPGGTRLLTTIFSLVIGIVTFTLIYAIIPRRLATWHSILPGAVLVGLGWEIGKDIFAWYLRSELARFSLVYGSLGAVITLLLWAYLNGIIVVLGAELNAAIGRRRLMTSRPRTGD